MTRDAPRRQALLKTLRGKSFRRALKALAELRMGEDPSLVGAIDADEAAADAQRGVQHQIARIVLARGVHGLVQSWPIPADATWRAELVSEIGQSFDLWVDEATVDLFLKALEDESPEVRAKAVWALIGILREIPARERRTARTDSHRRAIAARDRLRGWMTPVRSSRATRGLVAMLEQHRLAPSVVLPQIVEVLGYTATNADREALRALDALRSQSGEPVHVSYEALDESKLDWPEKLLAERRGIAPERIKMRISYRPTGLLDQKLLMATLERIQARAGSEKA
jgi:hypothetical protein